MPYFPVMQLIKQRVITLSDYLNSLTKISLDDTYLRWRLSNTVPVISHSIPLMLNTSSFHCILVCNVPLGQLLAVSSELQSWGNEHKLVWIWKANLSVFELVNSEKEFGVVLLLVNRLSMVLLMRVHHLLF